MRYSLELTLRTAPVSGSCLEASTASILDKIATGIRHLQRTEVRETEEFLSKK